MELPTLERAEQFRRSIAVLPPRSPPSVAAGVAPVRQLFTALLEVKRLGR